MRALTKNEVEVRIGTVGEKGVTLLLYKNARVDRAMLDEKFGALNWQNKYTDHKNNLFCAIGVYDPNKKEWIWKEDCGTESTTEKEKGEASDAFKRAGFRWGIGIELYNSPFIFLPVGTEKYGNGYKIAKPEDQKAIQRAYVSHMVSEDGKVTELDIAINNKIVWSTDKRKEGMNI